MKPSRWIKIAAMLLSVAMVTVMAVSPALAATGTYFTLHTATSNGLCDPGAPVVTSFTYGAAVGDTSYHIWTVTNVRTGTVSGPVSVGPIFPGGPFDITGIDINSVPTGTEPGDWLEQTVVATSTLGSGTTSTISFRCGDSRINWEAAESGPVAIYCFDDTLEVWDIDAVTGEGALSFTFSAWPTTAPATNTQLAGNGRNSLWQLTSGEIQVNSFPGEGKTYAFVFNGCPYDGNGYRANIDPAE